MARANPRQGLFDLLEQGVVGGVFPGCVALVWCSGAVLYHEGHGTLATHPDVPVRHEPVTRGTVYDLASLTKVLCSTTLVAMAMADGVLALDEPVPDPWSKACPGAKLRDLLEHCSGLPAHREYFTEVRPFDADAVLDRIAATSPEYSLRERAVYSDLGLMIVGAWIEQVMGLPLDVVFRNRIAYAMGLDDPVLPRLGFRRAAKDGWLAPALEHQIAPTEVYDPLLHPRGVPSHLPVRSGKPFAHGEVHDDNAWVMGGVAGHAGLFGTAQGVLELALAWLEGLLPGLEAAKTAFWRRSAVPGSTRCIGFDGIDPHVGAPEMALSPRAIGHLGYTGCSLWIDPAAGDPRVYILLSNRVHPTRANDKIKAFRSAFHRTAAELCNA